MATLKFYIRSSQKGDSLVLIRARLVIGRGREYYGKTNFLTPVNCWDNKKGTIKQSARFTEILTVEKAQSIVDSLIDLEKFIINEVNKVDKTSIPKEWLQNVICFFHSNYKPDEKKLFFIEEKESKTTFSIIPQNSTSSKKADITEIKEENRISALQAEINNTAKTGNQNPPLDLTQALEAEKLNKQTLNGYLAMYIEEAESGKRLTMSRGERFAESTIKTLKGFRNQFDNYQIKRGKIFNFEDITLEFYKDYTQYFTIEKEYSINTVGKMVQDLITIMLAANDDKLHNNLEVLNRKFKAVQAPVDNVYLTDERIDTLFGISRILFNPQNEKEVLEWNLEDMADITREAWKKAVTVFLAGCWSGQRFSDYSRINKDMIVVIEKKKYIKLMQEKTKKIVYIPLVPQLEKILELYGGYLPKISEQKVNTYIKLICKHIGFNEIITIKVRKAGKTKLVSLPFYEMVKTHTARRSFATNMLKSGASLSSIADITGHSSEQTLRRYLKLDAIEKAQLAAQCNYFQCA